MIFINTKLDKCLSINLLNYTDKNAYYTYFEHDIESSGADEAANQHNDLRRQLIAILDARATIVSMMTLEHAHNAEAIKHSYKIKKIEYDILLLKYLQSNRSLRKYLIQCCSNLRNNLLMYDN